MSNPYLTAFNNQFNEFFEEIIKLFPSDVDIVNTKNSLQLMKKMNPRLIILCWKDFIAKPYGEEIEKGGIDFFISKDYSKDIKNLDNTDKILEVIDRLRKPLSLLHEDDKKIAMQYLVNLTKLSLLYN